MLNKHQPSDNDQSLHATIVSELFADVFESGPVGLEDNFFELGGDSLTGAALMAAIEKRFGIVLSISVLLEASTPRALAAAIFQQSASRAVSCLITLNAGGLPPAIFCVHGNVGESTAPRRLSKAMSRRAFFGIRAIGLEDGEQPLTSVEAMAISYLARVAEAYPTGGIILLGHCAGATIVYEMAQQLAAAGRPAAGLVLIDPEISADFAPYLHESGLSLSLAHSSWRKRQASLEAAMAAHPNPTGGARRKIVAGAIKLAIGTYVPKPYDGPTLLLTSAERKAILLDNRRGYPALVRDLDVVELSVAHGQMFKRGMTEVAQAIDRFADRLTAEETRG